MSQQFFWFLAPVKGNRLQNIPKLLLTNTSGQKAFLFPLPLRFSNMLLLNEKVILSQEAWKFLYYTLFPAIDLPCMCDGENNSPWKSILSH